jgi:hypothetical protein
LQISLKPEKLFLILLSEPPHAVLACGSLI